MSKTGKLVRLVILIVVAIAAFMVYQWWPRGPRPGTVSDEAKLANRTPDTLSAAGTDKSGNDYFHDMDADANGPLPKCGTTQVKSGQGQNCLNEAEIKGRVTWIVWTGGDDRLWDTLRVKSFGALDFLKVLSSYKSKDRSSGEPTDKSNQREKNPKPWEIALERLQRSNRWKYLGLVNEPCFAEATGPDPNRFGLWLDRRKPASKDCPADPFENESDYPGVKVGSRGQPLPEGTANCLPPDRRMPVGSYYGYATGIVGLRLFPNPAFDAEAAKKWDCNRYYNDPNYYNSKDLVLPYRVGMSCGFCHVGPNPLKPPADPENPKWDNLSSNVGAQYFWVDRIFDWDADASSYIFQMFHTARPGTLDTSLVSTDNINNPRTMNAVYSLGPRLEQARRFGKETLAGGSLNNKQFNDFVPPDSPLSAFFIKPDTVYSPRVLKDAADSVGALGALNRVYLNIGLFSEEWLLHFNPLIGGKKVSPIEILVARQNSNYWLATEMQTPNMALFFLQSTKPHHLKDAPDGLKYFNGGKPNDSAYVQKVEHGKEMFANYCARCHSSKLPAHTQDLMPGGCSGKDYLTCWWNYWNWTKTDDFKSQMREIVKKPDFLEDNFLSSEFRIPVTLLQTNACSPLATNAIRDNIWDNFSSETYKELPSVGSITVYDPETGEPQPYKMPGGGRGFTRPASLISLWSTAPYLLNNSVGKQFEPAPKNGSPGYDSGYDYGYDYSPAPSVEKRMEYFDIGITQMLWPEKREQDPVIGRKMPLAPNGLPYPSKIDRTTEISYIKIKPGFVPDAVQDLGEWLFPRFVNEKGFELGPIPKGTPVGLIANLMARPEEMGLWARIQHDRKLFKVAHGLKEALDELGKEPDNSADQATKDAYNDRAAQALERFVHPLMELSKCPDYIVNRGHYFGTGYLSKDSGSEPPMSDDDKLALIEFLKTF